jgi:hypothetical protein
MSPPLLEHDYMGGSGAPSTEASSPDLRETELRLGLPGSELPERKHLTLELLPPSAKGKRGFSELKKDGGVSGDNMGAQRKEENIGKGKMEEKKPAGAAPAAKYIFSAFSQSFSLLLFYLCWRQFVKHMMDCWMWGWQLLENIVQFLVKYIKVFVIIISNICFC